MDAAAHVHRLARDLARPEALPHPAEHVEVIHTHASLVVLGGDHVYKLKKPVDLGFLDYSTLARRARFCTLEVSLNRRLAPDVYLGVLPVTEGPDGRLRLGGEGPTVDHAVHMRRLPEEDTLRHAVREGTLQPDDLDVIGRRLATFHAEAARPAVAREAASWDTVSALACDNLTVLRAHAEALGPLVAPLAEATERTLAACRPSIEARVGQACAFHGDLRLEHVYRRPERDPPDDVVVLDGIEFDDMLRHGDPVADVAFLAMDLQAYGAWPHARVLRHAWLAEAHDHHAAEVWPLYVSYRSAVRAKVAVLTATAPEVPAEARAEAWQRARRHVVLALGALLPRDDRPRLVITAGLPGSGKTTIARALAERLPLTVVSTDVVRKELAGLRADTSAAAAPNEGIYTPEMTARTYEACLDRARDALEAGRPVLVDGNHRDPVQRDRLASLARTLGVPWTILRCEAPDAELRRRLRARSGDASDADEAILDAVRPTWVPPEGLSTACLDTTAPDAVDRALSAVVRDG